MGAWIETVDKVEPSDVHLVAPYVGAWIETMPIASNSAEGCESHPTWVRGLKLSRVPYHALLNQSHPTWVRGLKHQ